ncbi:MAG TPA: ArsA-related P-loop ATPase [Acidobacteriota bacterium]|jgi:energy-coupling factor transporter ATP-binding protein EcfA2|nr:ArsA-related P-loop ATPase [Acidobacteriota bacterium]
MKKPIVVFCGKGGVGKTTLSLAFGLLHASRGKKVVVVTSHPLRELAVTVSLEGLKEIDAAAAANLFIIHIDPRQVLARTVKEQIRSKLLTRTVLHSKIYQSLIEVAPGLKELAFLARLQELAEHPSQDDLKFEVLIWDAPATGHFIDTLKVTKKFDVYLTGPFAAKGKELTGFFSHRANLFFFPVAILEEMGVQETIELCQTLRHELDIRPAGLICNLISPLLSAPEEAVEDLTKEFRGSGSEFEFILDRHRIERDRFDELRSSVRTTFHQIERVHNWKSDLDLLFSLAGRLGEMPLNVTS